MAAVLATSMLMGVTPHALGADAQGHYSVRGIGAYSCSDAEERSREDANFLPSLMTWLSGYLTASNRLIDQTFDAIFVTEARSVAELVLRLCGDVPEARLETAAAQLLQVLSPVRVRAQSATRQIRYGDQRIVLHEETLMRAQEHLAALGHYTGSIDGAYGPHMTAALRRFQQQVGLAQNGVPDSATLIRLFLADDT